MRRTIITLSALAVLATSNFTTAPASAAPIFDPSVVNLSTNVVDISSRDRFERRGNSFFLNGKRGYRYQRRGMLEYNGFWFPAAAFLGAVIISESMNNRPIIRGNRAHIRWCADHYRSYQISSNSFQPFIGPRKVCISPFY